MKTKFLLALTLVLSINTFAQIPKLKNIANLENSKFIIGLSDNEQLNENLKSVVNELWKIGQIDSSMPFKKALEKAKQHDDVYVLSVASYTTRSFKREENTAGSGPVFEYYVISNGKCIALFNGKKKPIFRSFIPAYDNVVPKESIIHGINFMQEVSKTMIKDNLNNGFKALSLFKKDAALLKTKTLFIPKMFLNKKLTEASIKKYYDSNFKIATQEEWKDAIISRKKDIAYIILVPVPVGGNYIYQHHIIDAETSKIYALLQPKVGIAMQSGTRGVRDINLSKSNTGYINKKNIKKYGKVLTGKW